MGESGQERTNSVVVVGTTSNGSGPTDHPDFSVRLVIENAVKAGKVPEDVVLMPTTVHRQLSSHGLMHPEDAVPPGDKDRRRFAFAKAGELWMSDVMHGQRSPSATSPARRT